MPFVNHIDELKKYFKLWKRQFIKSKSVMRFIDLYLGYSDLLKMGGFDPEKSNWKRVCATKSVILPNFTEKRPAIVLDDHKFQPLFYTNAMVAIVQRREWCQSVNCFKDDTVRPEENEWFSLEFIPFSEFKEVVVFPNMYSGGSYQIEYAKGFSQELGIPLKVMSGKPEPGTVISYAFKLCDQILFKAFVSMELNIQTASKVLASRFDPFQWDLAYLLDQHNGFDPIEVKYSYDRKGLMRLESIFGQHPVDVIEADCNFFAKYSFNFSPKESETFRKRLIKYTTEILQIYFDF
jgi:hypothetical protein